MKLEITKAKNCNGIKIVLEDFEHHYILMKTPDNNSSLVMIFEGESAIPLTSFPKIPKQCYPSAVKYILNDLITTEF